jgi:hypothetical protein
MASEHYAAVTAELHKMVSSHRFKAAEYRKLKAEVEQAREAYDMASAALRVHRERHSHETGL